MSRLRADPADDPNVQALRGWDVTRLSVADLAAAGVTLTGYRMVSVERGTHPGWATHSEFVARRPAWDVMAASVARSLTADHVRGVEARAAELEAQGDAEGAAQLLAAPLAGLRLPRSFPCLGLLRIQERAESLIVVQCDVCGDTFGIVQPAEQDAEGDKPATPAGGEPWPF